MDSGGCHADAYAAASQRAWQRVTDHKFATQTMLKHKLGLVLELGVSRLGCLMRVNGGWVSRPEFGPPKGADLSTCRRASDADWFKSLLAVPAAA